MPDMSNNNQLVSFKPIRSRYYSSEYFLGDNITNQWLWL